MRFHHEPAGCVCTSLDTSQMNFHLAKQRQEGQRSFRGRRGGMVPFQGCGKGLRISPSTSPAVGWRRCSAWVTLNSHRFCWLKGSHPTKPPTWRAQADNRGGEKLVCMRFYYNLGWTALIAAHILQLTRSRSLAEKPRSGLESGIALLVPTATHPHRNVMWMGLYQKLLTIRGVSVLVMNYKYILYNIYMCYRV